MKLNIVSLDNPFPPNYGGAIDIYYKIKSLQSLGCEIHLHYYYSTRQPQSKIEEFCKTVQYYQRNSILSTLISVNLPYVVASRNSRDLLENLGENDFPILFEGLQSSKISNSKSLKNRKKYLRTHNVESYYMFNLAKAENSVYKKIALKLDGFRYLKFEKKLHHFNSIFTISNNDNEFYSKYHSNIKTVLPFHGNQTITSQEGKGSFILYHGNFDVSENLKSAKYLIENVFNGLKFPVKIAGKNALKKLNRFNNLKNIELIENLSNDEMNYLINSAHINILPTFQATGVKLKLLNGLFNGRFCIVNNDMIAPTTFLKPLCEICNIPKDYKIKIEELFKKEFSTNDIKNRELILNKYFNDIGNAQLILNEISNE